MFAWYFKLIEAMKIQKNSFYFKNKLACLLICIGAFTSSCAQKSKHSNQNQDETKEDSVRITHWKEDLTFLKAKFETEHYDLFRIMTKKEWEAGFETLLPKLPQLRDHEVITEAMKIISKIGDGHTSIYIPFQGNYQFHQIPIAFQKFKDGIFIKGADARYKNIIGKEVIAIGGVPIETIKQRLKSITPKDNEQWLKVLGIEVYMTISEILYAINGTDDILNVKITVKDSDNTITTAHIAAELFDISKVRFADVRPDWSTAHDSSENPLPRYLKRINTFPDDFYWFEHLEDQGMVYFQLNVVFDKPNKNLNTFCKELFQFIGKHHVEKLVIDIRLNSGGNNQLNEALINQILKSKQINQKGNLYVIVGRRTFSAAMNLATNLEQRTQAIFVGEYTGSSPNFVGEDNQIILPNSKLICSASNRYWQDAPANDKRSWIVPEHFHILSSNEYKNNLDPCMEKVFKLIGH